MKRFVSLCLAFVMAFSLCITPIEASYSITPDFNAINDEAVSFLDKHHIDKEKLISVENIGNLSKTYIYQLTDTVISKITIEEKENSNFLTIKEGSLVNTLEITNDGQYILNGNVVTISGNDILQIPNYGIITPCYPADTYYTETCPYGKASDYTTYVRSNEVGDISFGTAFINITLTAFTAIIGAVVHPILGLSVSFASAILLSFQEYDPHSMSTSYKEKQYVHNTKGSFVTIEKSVLMFDMDLWTQANFQGTVVHRIAYKVTLWENGEG